ncbi:MAG: DoxX family protein [Bacteroidota bacterium]
MKLTNPFGFTTEGRITDLSLLLLRITFGGLMLINHGIGKFNSLMAGGEIKFPPIMGMSPKMSLTLAVFAEVLCAVMVVLGLFTRLAVIPLIITMLVAIFVIHISDPFKKMEMAILYLIPYLVLFWNGSGKYSVDEFIS